MGKGVDYAVACCVGMALIASCSIDRYDLCCAEGSYKVSISSASISASEKHLYTVMPPIIKEEATHCTDEEDRSTCMAVCRAYVNASATCGDLATTLSSDDER